MNQATFNQLGFNKTIAEQVLNLATLTQQAGLDGVVCSAMEAAVLRQTLGSDFFLVTPGIRSGTKSGTQTVDQDDQSRVVTPQDALNNGASYLVIGRPITQAADPLKALEMILKTIGHL